MTRLILGIALAGMMVTQSVGLQVKRNPSWNQISEMEFECLNQALIQRYGASIDLLDALGFGLDDKRIALLRLRCQQALKNIKRGPSKNEVPWPK